MKGYLCRLLKKGEYVVKRLLGLFVLLACVISSQAQEEKKFYLWNTSCVHLKLNSDYKMKFSSKIHYLPEEHFRDMTYLDFALSRKMNDWFSLGLAFRGAQTRKETGDVMEYRPQFVTGLQLPKSKIKCKTTNRLEYRTFSEGDAYARYYHNIFVRFPGQGAWPKPYLGEELFTKLSSDGMHLARIYGGLEMLKLEYLRIDMYYVWQQTKRNNDWQGADAVGINLHFFI